MMMTVKSLSALALSHQGPIAGEKNILPKNVALLFFRPLVFIFTLDLISYYYYLRYSGY